MAERPVRRVFRNPWSIVGAVLVTASAVLFLFVFLLDLFGMHTNPYLGIVFFLLLPAAFVFGLLLIPVGALLERRRLHKGLPARQWPRIDFNDALQRRDGVRGRAPDARERAHRVAGRVSRDRVHGLAAVLRTGVPYRHAARVHGVPGRSALARALRRLPYRPRRLLVREIEAGRHAAGHRRAQGHVFTSHRFARPQPAPGPRHLRAVPLAGEVPRRQSGSAAGVCRRRSEHRIGDDGCSSTSAAEASGSASAAASTGT